MSKAADAPRQNRLAAESSAYLRQHMHNPVDWYPWGPEALEQARRRDKPLLVSIGYSACHWCHVMEHESFEDPETAALMNEHFIPIKVDREERPDLDQIYMDTVTRLTGHGGWPLTVFCTPDGTPFYGGTYFPPEPRQGMPSFRQLLLGVARGLSRASRRGEAERGAHPGRAGGEGPRPRGERAGSADGGPGCAAPAPGCGQRARRLRLGAQVSDALLSRAAAGGGRRAARTQGARGARARDLHLSRDGARRRLRPAWAAASTATASTRAGRCRTSRRCSTTRDSSCASTPRPGAAAAPATKTCSGRCARPRRTCAARCALPRAASTRARTPTARARRASTTSSPPSRSTRCSAPRPAPPSAAPTA